MTFIAIFHFVPPKKVIIFNRCKFQKKMLLYIYFIEKNFLFHSQSSTNIHLYSCFLTPAVVRLPVLSSSDNVCPKISKNGATAIFQHRVVLALLKGILEYFPVHTYHIALLYAYAYQLIELRKTYQLYSSKILFQGKCMIPNNYLANKENSENYQGFVNITLSLDFFC